MFTTLPHNQNIHRYNIHGSFRPIEKRPFLAQLFGVRVSIESQWGQLEKHWKLAHDIPGN